ncbi:MAG: hypothetical protein OER95_10870 [Acidimicrobiia bacterium]|nr:hypothetical protein [Acidimicrobiia bacterium]
MSDDLRQRLLSAWQGRISGCQLGKPVELLSMREGLGALTSYLERADALPLRDYVPLVADTTVARHFPQACRRSTPDKRHPPHGHRARGRRRPTAGHGQRDRLRGRFRQREERPVATVEHPCE